MDDNTVDVTNQAVMDKLMNQLMQANLRIALLEAANDVLKERLQEATKGESSAH